MSDFKKIDESVLRELYWLIQAKRFTEDDFIKDINHRIDLIFTGKQMDIEKEKQERLGCPFCNPHTHYGASPEFFDQWKIKHEYHCK